MRTLEKWCPLFMQFVINCADAPSQARYKLEIKTAFSHLDL